MTHLDQESYRARSEWGPEGVAVLAPVSDVVVIVDVLSFCTSVDIAVCRGAVVLPYPFRDASVSGFARAEHAELAGRGHPRGYTLAPHTLTGIEPGTRLVLPSPNGSTLAHAAAGSGAAVFAGCLRNAAAVARAAAAHGGSIAVIPAGERWPYGSLRPAIEDLIGAGAILAHLDGERSPEAELAVAAYRRFEGALRDALAGSTSGREKALRSETMDVDLAAALDSSAAVPRLEIGAFTDAALRQ